jgi:nitroreductase
MHPRELQLNVVEDSICSRRSIRSFLGTQVPRELIERLIAVSSCAPSGSNTQPWGVHVLLGEKKTRLSKQLVDAHHREKQAHSEEYQYESRQPLEPYMSRKRDFGARLYGRLGIEYSDNPQRHNQIARNYEFFGAPVGLIFTLHSELGLGSWLDCGMFLQNIMVAARSHGLDTCAQVSFAKYHRLIKPALDIPDIHTVVCGMAIGYADHSAPENQGWMPRETLDAFATIHDDAPPSVWNKKLI